MDLSSLVPLMDGMPAFRRLVRRLSQKGGQHDAVVIGAAQPYVVAALFDALTGPMVVVLPDAEEAQRFYGQLLLWCDSRPEVMLFPEPDALPYERMAPDSFIEHQRLRTLAGLVRAGLGPQPDGPVPLIVASAAAAARKTLSPSRFSRSSHVLRQGMNIDPHRLLKKWDEMGYRRSGLVEVPGTMSQRGGILDVYPPNSELPARIEFFGNEVDSIRLFDPRDQRSLHKTDVVEVVPAQEEADGDTGILAEYLPPQSLVILVEPGEMAAAIDELDARAGQLRQSRIEEGDMAEDSPFPYVTYPELIARLEPRKRLILTRWSTDDSSSHRLAFASAPRYGGRVDLFLEEAGKLCRRKRSVVLVSQQSARLAELLQEGDVLASPIVSLRQPPALGSVALVQGSLAEGWRMGRDLVVFTDSEVFGFVKQPRLSRPRPAHHLSLLPDLSPGDYAVHVEHGIARFAGMSRVPLDGVERDYLALDYSSGDRLYVPVDQADRVSRYIGSADEPPALTRLGTHEWERAKQRVKESAKEMARDLLGLYAAREVAPGFAFSPDTTWQQEMEASFPYVETPDQNEVVRQVKEDMERPKPMDRLVCGDVGYGKTEVALRAAFKTVMDGKQVAILVPTTVLAQQHFTTFVQRLAAFPVKVEMLSRFRSDKEQQSVLAGLEMGSIDICIGTHRLLQKDVVFKDLGLVIIDEEQRFGVAHKERLRQMRREVDVLTLGATPIPRTLHMSLVGVRDMSTMETPPEERLPIKTYVGEYSDSLVREAIVRELERDGQVFFVHNRVHSIGRVARRLADLVPEAIVDVAHGQMHEDRLEKTMLDFIEGRIDVLACTTIIESGLDIPNVNTLIVDDADRLGLAQLYQLRGRVGRGSNRAYAYFLHGKGKRLTPAAGKRLETIFEATELGSGFRIALKDLEIRGAGNLLGAEQSGYIAAVGFDLYSRLLAEAVRELKAGEGTATVDMDADQLPTVDLPLSAYIPEEYVADIAIRLNMYQRLARARSVDEVSQIREELRDRFGSLPGKADSLLYVVDLRVLAAQAGIYSIATERRQIVVRLKEGSRFDRERLGRFGRSLKVGRSQLRLDMATAGKTWQSVLREVVQVLSHQG